MSDLDGVQPGVVHQIVVHHRQLDALGARFHCVGIDRSFADTPGLLLNIHVPGLSPRHLDRYFGSGKDAYLRYRHDDR